MNLRPIARAARGVLTNCVLLAAALAAAGPLSSRAEDDPAKATAKLQEQTVDVMRQVLKQEHEFVKVHAAEYLLALDYTDGIKETFLEEQELHGSESPYCIGIWRVLARAASNDQEQAEWINRIREVAFNPAAANRLHATETLAKLRYKLRGEDELASVEDELASMTEAAKPENGTLAPYAAWVLLNAESPGAEAHLAELLSSDQVEVRAGAAYALRHQSAISSATLEKLLAAVQKEPAESTARVFVVTAAAVHATCKDQPALKTEMAKLAANGTGDEKVEACQTLAQMGDDSDLPTLSELLDDPNPDARSTAANAMLRISRRAPHRLQLLDWGVIILYALGMLSVGWYYSRRTTTQEEYLLGGRQMSPLMVGVSLFASLFSCISYLALPGEIIKYGPMILGSILAYPFVALIIGWFIIPFIMKLKVTSAYEILELRFGPAVRTLGSLLFLSLRLMWMSVIVYAMTTKVLVPLSGLPPWTTPIVCTLLAFVTIVYTAMGGLRAVVITDVIQAVILFGAAIVTVVTISVSLGGVQQWWPTHWPAHWPEPQFGYDPGSRVPLFVIILSTLTWYVCTSASDQIAIQRYLSTKDAKSARSVLFISLAADVCVSIILAMVGLSLLAYFRVYPHLLPDAQTVLADGDKLFPQFILVGLPVGLSGLVVAGLLACAMSALSAGINSTCSVLTVDVLDRIRGTKRSADSGSERVGELKHVSLLIGLIVVALSLFVNMVQGNLLEICYKVVNLLTAPLAGLFLLAMFVPWARAFGALVGAAAGLAVVIAVSYWREITGEPGISFLWAMPLGLLAEMIVGSLVSLIPIGRDPQPLK